MIFAGIDVGSRSTKAVILNKEGEVLSWDVQETGVNGSRAAEKALQACLERTRMVQQDLSTIVSTGYGKKGVISAARRVTEITCHARGASVLVPGTRTVIDIGGQDSKVILLNEEGSVIDFAMNDRCAAGTGRFLEFMARVLQMDLLEMSRVLHQPSKTASISSLCTVFAESEVISLLSQGCSVDDLVRGLHMSVAERTETLLKRIPYSQPLTMTGGVAKNLGVIRALEERLKVPLQIPEEPQIVGALGAAHIARSNGPG